MTVLLCEYESSSYIPQRRTAGALRPRLMLESGRDGAWNDSNCRRVFVSVLSMFGWVYWFGIVGNAGARSITNWLGRPFERVEEEPDPDRVDLAGAAFIVLVRRSTKS